MEVDFVSEVDRKFFANNMLSSEDIGKFDKKKQQQRTNTDRKEKNIQNALSLF